MELFDEDSFTSSPEPEANTNDQQIVNPKGEMKGSAITGPVGKEAAELWPVCLAGLDPRAIANVCTAYCEQLRCRDVTILVVFFSHIHNYALHVYVMYPKHSFQTTLSGHLQCLMPSCIRDMHTFLKVH